MYGFPIVCTAYYRGQNKRFIVCGSAANIKIIDLPALPSSIAKLLSYSENFLHSVNSGSDNMREACAGRLRRGVETQCIVSPHGSAANPAERRPCLSHFRLTGVQEYLILLVKLNCTRLKMFLNYLILAN